MYFGILCILTKITETNKTESLDKIKNKNNKIIKKSNQNNLKDMIRNNGKQLEEKTCIYLKEALEKT